jgi:hypothetical protein
MPNTEVTSTSWFTRLKNALTGIVVGFILLIASVVLLFWNEGRAVQTYESLVEGQGAVVAASADTVDASLEGKLIHLQGPITPMEDPEDADTGVFASGAVALKRTVEMYQWIETSDSKTEKKLGGGEETVTTYSYNLGWHVSPQNSAEFFNPDGHQNPPMPVENAEFAVSQAGLGAYVVSGEKLAPLGKAEALEFSAEDADYIGSSLGLDRPMQPVTGALYAGLDPQKPELGDLRVIYERVDVAEASFVAKQAGNGLEDYVTSNGYKIFLSAAGLVSSDKMFADAQDTNTMITWLVRAGGLILMFVGFAATLKILSVVGDLIPFVGTVIGYGTGLFSLVATLCLGSIVIAFGWFAARPLMSVAILAVAALIIGGIAYAKRKSATAAAAV